VFYPRSLLTRLFLLAIAACSLLVLNLVLPFYSLYRLRIGLFSSIIVCYIHSHVKLAIGLLSFFEFQELEPEELEEEEEERK
jgi:hypothetical protein